MLEFSVTVQVCDGTLDEGVPAGIEPENERK
jgi:hypothetical protein